MDRAQLAVDWFIQSQGGSTVLRLVHSGFKAGGEWDAEYDATRRGWDHELRSLRHYLEHHRGTNRIRTWIEQPVAPDPAAAWARLMSPGALLQDGTLEGLGSGDRYAVTLASGDALEGRVELQEPPLGVTLSVENLNHALLRIGYETCTGTPGMHLWLSTWGVPVAEVEARRRRWEKLLSGLFPARP
ncbi:MAG: SRPBCC domain-containing protein [Acidobacteriota bacterium]